MSTRRAVRACGLAAVLVGVAASARGTAPAHASRAAPVGAAAVPVTVLAATEQAPTSSVTTSTTTTSTTTSTTTTSTTVAPTVVAPVDPWGPRCADCPAVQPDPARPVVARGDARAAPVVSSVRTTDPVVFLTIDDGEHWDLAGAMRLAEARVPFTLFLTQQYIADKIPLMQQLTRVGGWVELHTVSHPNLFRARNDATEICAPLAPYEEAFGRRSTLFRPPYGNANGTTQTVAGSCGVQAVVLWRASMNYGALATQGGELRAGDIVLMHFRPDLADNLTELFRVVREKGLRLGRLECYVGGDPRCGRPWR